MAALCVVQQYFAAVTTALQQPLHSQWDPVPSGPRSSGWPAAVGGQTRPVAEEAAAGWSHQQGASGFLPEGLEDPAEVSRPVY